MLDTYTDATTTQRYDAINDLLALDKNPPNYKIEFQWLRGELLSGSYYEPRFIRDHWLVSIINTKYPKNVETFTYFGPRKMGSKAMRHFHTSTLTNTVSHPPAKLVDKQDRLLSFIYCIASDYAMIDQHGIRDGFDYMDEMGCTAQEARETFNALRTQFDKLTRLQMPMRKLNGIMEGY